MARYVLALLILLQPAPSLFQQDIDTILRRAQALYLDAQFQESIDFLLPLDMTLRSIADQVDRQINVKLQLALSHIGLGQTQQAIDRFKELCALDPEYSLDPKRFAQKVISLFDDAKADQAKVTCQIVCTEADRLLETGEADGLLMLIQSRGTRCACLYAAAMDAATHFYQRGVEAYKRNDFTAALQDLRTAMKFQPAHDLAGVYIELIQNKLRLDAGAVLLEWRADVDAREFGLAAVAYRRLQSINIEGAATQALEQMRAGYRQQLSPMVQSWKQACSSDDGVAMKTIRRQTEELLPDPAIRQDLLADITSCPKKATTNPASP